MLQTVEFLAQVCAEIRKNGFIGTKQAKAERIDSTGSRAFWDLTEGNGFVEEEDVATASEVLEYITEMDDPEKGFMRDCREASLNETLRTGTENLLAALVEHYRNREQAESFEDSDYVGVIGEQHATRAQVVAKRTGIGRYESKMIRFVDGDGNLIVWWCSTMPDVNVGDDVRLVGKVKAHNVYRGETQTLMTRCKVALAPS